MKKVVSMMLSVLMLTSSVSANGWGDLFGGRQSFLQNDPFGIFGGIAFEEDRSGEYDDFSYPVFVMEEFEVKNMVTESEVKRATALSNNHQFRYYVNDYVSQPRVYASNINTSLTDAYVKFDEILLSNDDKTNFYEVVLLAILTHDSKAEMERLNEEEYAKDVADGIYDILSAHAEDNPLLKMITDGESGKAFDFASMLVDSIVSSEKHYTEMSCLALVEESNLNVLRTIKANTSNPYLIEACDRLLYECGAAVADVVIESILTSEQGKPMREYAVELVVDAVTGEAGTIVSAAKAFTELFFNTDDISANSMTIAAHAEIEKVLRDAVKNAENNFRNNPNFDTANKYNALAEFLKVTYIVGCEEVQEYVDSVPDEGFIRYYVKKDGVQSFADAKNNAKNIAAVEINKISNTNFFAEQSTRLQDYFYDKYSLEFSSWSAADINKAKNLSILTPDRSSNYQDPITRAEFCELLTNMLVKKTGKPIEQLIKEKGIEIRSPFSDTEYKYVDYMYKLGIVNGTSASTFSPLDKITREQAATMLANAAEILGSDITTASRNMNAFENMISPWARNGVGFVIENGIMSGTGNGFDPQGYYTKEQAIITMVRMFDKL